MMEYPWSVSVWTVRSAALGIRCPAMEVTLNVIRGKVNRGEISFRPPAVLGRSREADLTIAHPMVSRHHCELFEVDGLLMVRDLGSLNGTMVHESRVVQAALCPDESFSVGPLTFQVRYQYDGDLDAVPPPTLAEPVVDKKLAGSAPLDEVARPTETPRFLDAGPEPVAESSDEAGSWSNAMPSEDDGLWVNVAPAEEAVAAEDAASAEPDGESPLYASRSEPTVDESPVVGFAEAESSDELVSASGAETKEQTGPKLRLDEAEPGDPIPADSTPAEEPETVPPEPKKKKRHFSLWPFGGGKKRSKTTAKQGKPAPKSSAALLAAVELPAASPESLPVTAGGDDAPRDEAVADLPVNPDPQPEEPEVAAEPAEPAEPEVVVAPDKPSESSGEDDAFEDFLKGIQ